MNRLILVVLFGLIACSPSHGGEVANGLIAMISRATTVECIESILVLDGDQIFCLETDSDEKLYVLAKCSGPRAGFSFLELRFGLDKRVSKYVLRDDLKDAYSKLKKMIGSIKVEAVEDKDVRTTLPYLVRHL